MLCRMKRTMMLRAGDCEAKTSKWSRCAGGGPVPRVKCLKREARHKVASLVLATEMSTCGE